MIVISTWFLVAIEANTFENSLEKLLKNSVEKNDLLNSGIDLNVS